MPRVSKSNPQVPGAVFDTFLAPEGEYATIPLTVEQKYNLRHLRLWVQRSGWHYRTAQLALYMIDQMMESGLRLEVDATDAAQALGVRRGVIYYHLNRLRELDFLWGERGPRKWLLPRRKSLRYEYETAKGEHRWWATKSVHQISQRLRRWLKDVSPGQDALSNYSLVEIPL